MGTKKAYGMNFSFDVGMASLGVAVNKENEIIHADVLLMHEDAGSVKDQAERRRQHRTREAHKAREHALENLWRAIGKTPLQRKRFEKIPDGKNGQKFKKTPADQRLEREFPAKGDDTVYASSLLRIMLLEGKPLQDWQIYKALHAAIQRRGYDSNVPWRSKSEETAEDNDKSKEAEESKEKANDFDKKLAKMTANPKCQLPCYYDAWRMGMWDNQTEKITHIRQPKRSPQKEKDQVRGYTPSREVVTEELTRLLEQAAKQIADLQQHLNKDKDLRNTLYGNQQNAKHERYPSASEIKGLLGQKYPRFENRIVSKCALIPRLNVCKAEKPLAIEVGFLMRLVNWRYEIDDDQGEKHVRFLNGSQIEEQFDKCVKKWSNKKKDYDAEGYAKCFKLTKSGVKTLAEKLGGSAKAGHEEIPESKHAGRSRFSQPALYLLKELILSEKTPAEFWKELSQLVKSQEKADPGAEFGYQIFSEVPYKYFVEDFRFLEKMGGSRDAIYIPDISLAEKYQSEGDDKYSAIRKVIGSCNWPELRHRLNEFHKQLDWLIAKFGEPDAVHLEFIREDFLGEKEKKRYTKQADAGREDKREAINTLKENGIPVNDKNILRVRLYREQNKECLYTSDPLSICDLESYEVDHIFPKEDGGPDAQYNYVLTTRTVNSEKMKGKKLPCECDFINSKWAAYKNRVNALDLSKNKKRLLLASNRDEAEGLIEKYTGLSGTAHIARLARDIVCLRLGWQPGEKDNQQRVFVFSGGLTSKVGRQYELYTALGDGSKKYQKDRSDHRHHALDAMVISYLREWARDAGKTEFFKFPKGIDANYFAEKLQDVYPHYVTKIKPAIAEQPKRRPAIADLPKSRGEINLADFKKEFKNISKDPDERGQWYTNKTETGKGTSQHGYLFYKDEKGKVCSKTIHSFRSPYDIKKEFKRKGVEIIGLLHAGKRIRLPSQNNILANQLGRDARPKFGEYRIVDKKKKDAVIANIDSQGGKSNAKNPAFRYRISNDNLHKIVICNALLIEKQTFKLDQFSVSKDKLLTGNYRIEDSEQDPKSFAIVNVKTKGKETVNLYSLVKDLFAQKLIGEPAVNDLFEINRIHLPYIRRTKTDDLSGQDLPEGTYVIKGFGGNAKRVELTSQNGTIYSVNSKILTLAESINK